MGRIAVTGTSGILGSRLLQRLCESGPPERLISLDPAPCAVPGVESSPVDLTREAVDETLLALFRAQRVDRVVHLAFRSDPSRDATAVHRLESLGTRALLAAAAAAGVEHVVMRSSTALYGAHADAPEQLDEEQPLRADPALGWARDKLEAEQHAASFARRHAAMRVTLLRFAPLLGAGVSTFYSRLLERRLVVVPAGCDPQVQLLHPDDAVDAIVLALDKRPAGPVNVVPRSTLPLRRLLELCDRRLIPCWPGPMRLLFGVLWTAGVGSAPPGFVEYACHPWVADGERARRELGFEARYRSREALASWLGERRGLRRRPLITRREGRPSR